MTVHTPILVYIDQSYTLARTAQFGIWPASPGYRVHLSRNLQVGIPDLDGSSCIPLVEYS